MGANFQIAVINTGRKTWLYASIATITLCGSLSVARQLLVSNLGESVIMANNTNNYTKAVQIASAVLFLDPKNSTALEERGWANEMLAHPEASLEDYKAAASLGTKNARTYFRLGIDHMLKNEYEMALSYYDKAIFINPQTARYYFNRSIVYSHLGRKQDSQNDVATGKKLSTGLNNNSNI